MHLYVMRHGPAEDHAPGGRDADRPLSHQGRGVVLRAAEELRRLRGAGPVRIVASPLARAAQTADILRSVLGVADGSVQVDARLVPTDDPPLAVVEELSEEGADVVLVSHQPTAELLVRELTSSRDGRGHPALPVTGFRTGVIVALEGVVSMAPAEPALCRPFSSSSSSSFPTWRIRLVIDPHR